MRGIGRSDCGVPSRPSRADSPATIRSPGTPIRAAHARASGPWPKKHPSRPATAAASSSWQARGQVSALCSLPTTGTWGGVARAAAHHAPNMCPCTRSAPATRSASQPAKSPSGSHCNPRTSEKCSTSKPWARATSRPAGDASPATISVSMPWGRSARLRRSALSWAPPGSSTPIARRTGTAGGWGREPRTDGQALGGGAARGPPLGELAAEVDRADVVLGRQLAQHLEHDRLDVALLVAEVVEEDLQRGVRDLELRGGELEPERGLVPGDQVLLVGHAVLLASRGFADSTPVWARPPRGQPARAATATYSSAAATSASRRSDSRPVPHEAVSRLLGPAAAGLSRSRARAPARRHHAWAARSRRWAASTPHATRPPRARWPASTRAPSRPGAPSARSNES